jgi:pSer/pThr/pTyr-binding forkhead associated (FHA) protein
LPFGIGVMESYNAQTQSGKRTGQDVRIVLPYVNVVDKQLDLSKSILGATLNASLESSRTRPCYLEIYDGTQQRFLFFRGGQIYAAGCIQGLQYQETTIREFLLAVGRMNFPQLTCYELSSKMLHSILILFQKKPALRVETTLVDLDELLDKIEAEGKSCIVSASHENFVAMLRYEKGAVESLFHEQSLPTPREGTFREEFLVKIYTITAEKQLTISLYEDLLVTYASDAKTVDTGFDGNFEELYLAKPPVISLQFKDKEIDHWVFDRPQFKIGRTPDNDIVIDNLAVSRLHALLEEEKGNYYVRDCDSLNGTLLNNQKVGRARLEDGDEICIGKHSIIFRRQGGQAVPVGETIEGFDQTVIINTPLDAIHVPQNNPQVAKRSKSQPTPRLIMKTEFGDRVIELKKDSLTIGSDIGSDVVVEGLFVAKKHAEIVRENNKIVLRHLRGLRKVSVRGKPVREVELKNNDEIKIAKDEFIFQE